jgi:hypothetical protein
MALSFKIFLVGTHAHAHGWWSGRILRPSSPQDLFQLPNGFAGSAREPQLGAMEAWSTPDRTWVLLGAPELSLLSVSFLNFLFLMTERVQLFRFRHFLASSHQTHYFTKCWGCASTPSPYSGPWLS